MRALLIFISLSFFVGISAQENSFPLELKISGGATLSGYKVVLTQNNSNLSNKLSDKSGKVFFTDLPYNNVYQITLSKKGMVDKTLLIDAKKGYFQEDTDPTEVFIEILMINELEFVDYSIVTERPVGKMIIDSQSGKLDWDNTYNTSRKKEIDAFLAKATDLSKENKNTFTQLLNTAEAEIINHQFEQANNHLESAKKIGSSDRLRQLEITLQKEKAKDNSENDMIAKITHIADSLFDISELPKALKYYERIQRLSPNNLHAIAQIEEINRLLTIHVEPTPKIKPVFSQEEMMANARRAQENRINSYQEYQAPVYSSTQRNWGMDTYQQYSKPNVER